MIRKLLKTVIPRLISTSEQPRTFGRFFFTLFMALGMMRSVAARGAEVVWLAGLMQYDRLALSAMISGDVALLCEIDSNGRVSRVTSLSGHMLLSKLAEENVKEWRFATKTQVHAFPVTYKFRIVGQPRASPKTRFFFEAPNQVYVESDPLLATGPHASPAHPQKKRQIRVR